MKGEGNNKNHSKKTTKVNGDPVTQVQGDQNNDTKGPEDSVDGENDVKRSKSSTLDMGSLDENIADSFPLLELRDNVAKANSKVDSLNDKFS